MVVKEGVDTSAAESAVLRAIVDKLPAMLAYWGKDLRCRFANRDYERWFGVKPEAMIGRDMEEFLGPLFALNLPYIQGALRGEEQLFEREIPDPAGGPSRHSQAHYIPDIADGCVLGFCVLVVDITRRKKAEEALIRVERQLRAAEHTAALATLAAGIAHEINNPLAVVLANLEATLGGLQLADDRAPMRAELLEAYEGAKRVSAIVRSMKLLARSEAASREPVDVNQTLEQSIDATANVVRYRARLARDLRDVGCVHGNRAQLAQVFVNLLINAAQALKEGATEHNEIRVRTRREAGTVVIEIEDNGCGIPPESLPHIFEPFFTTKDVGVGIGLGLSISNTIVSALGGTLCATSSVGEGSVFRVVLPAALEAAVARAPRHAGAVTEHAPRLARETAHLRVLVVDDDEAIRKLLRRILGQRYDVTIVSSGREALAALSTSEPGFDAILCDLMMPEMTGADVYAEVSRLHPALLDRFVFMTGGSFTPSGRAFLGSVPAPVLDKPFNFAEVTAAILQAASKASPSKSKA